MRVRRVMAAADTDMMADLSWADILGVLDELPMLAKIWRVWAQIVYTACPSTVDGGLACEHVDVIRKSFGY